MSKLLISVAAHSMLIAALVPFAVLATLVEVTDCCNNKESN